MGQKVPPKANRLGFIESWDSQWFVDFRTTPEYVEQDQKIRQYIVDKYRHAIISKIVVERTGGLIIINIYTVRPGIVIGKGGENINEISGFIRRITGSENVSVRVTEVKQPALDAQCVAEFIALALEKNMNYRRVIKNAIARTMESGALGIKVRVSGRLAGVEIARSEWFREGRIPSNTFRALISYGFSEAIIKKGKIGVKVWIFLKELLTKEEQELARSGKIELLLTQEDKGYTVEEVGG
ncbi:MAG: 30S ribosomal protein S3 [Endomicrobia bacterium]|nr:30S ribosomal protein S3 [Endomicrobiia bacterium]MDW8055500.1 30S ribosomal protein S3 [Elusimicrobiota bacterium]